MGRLSVTIITLNEEKYIEKCIESVLGIADEVVVVDSGSVDGTVEIAKKLGANVYFRRFDNYASQKNYAVAKASGEWILSMDGDETLDERAKEEVLSVIKTKKYDAYSMPRKNIIFGKFIKYSRWQPELDRHVWFFRKVKGRWVGDVHEEVAVDGRIGKLKYGKVHYQYETISEFFTMMNRYSGLDAGEKFKKGVRFSIFKLVFTPFYTFLVRFFYRLGFLDGWRGFVLSYLMSVYQIEVLVKVWELQVKKWSELSEKF